MNIVKNHLEKVRSMRGWTVDEAAGKLNMKAIAYSRLESGAKQLTVGKLLEIADAFGVLPEELFEVIDKPVDKLGDELVVLEKTLMEKDLEVISLQLKLIELYDRFK